MYEPDAMGNTQPAFAVELAEVARQRPLAIYAGAGLSQARPTDIPDGAGDRTALLRTACRHTWTRRVELRGPVEPHLSFRCRRTASQPRTNATYRS